MMPMSLPIARFNMKFDISPKQPSLSGNNGINEARSAIAVFFPGINYLELFLSQASDYFIYPRLVFVNFHGVSLYPHVF